VQTRLRRLDVCRALTSEVRYRDFVLELTVTRMYVFLANGVSLK
jgi:hypothetical protein